MKKTKKQQRIDAEKAALRDRLRDFLDGAHGGYSMSDPDVEEEFPGIAAECGVDTFARFVGAIERVLLDPDQAWLVRSNNLSHFDYLSKATDFLYEQGIRG